MPHNELKFFAVTREYDGIVNLYIGDKETVPELSGTANQNSGTPEAGTTVRIGNRSTSDRTFDGQISDLAVVEGILTTDQISEYYEQTMRDGESMYFDGAESIVDTGADIVGTGDVTVSAWINPSGWGENNYGRVFVNEKTIFYLDGANERIEFTSDRTTEVDSANNSISLNEWQHVLVTRESDGTANFYIDGKLSGTADQDSGTPAAGTTNLFIGNRAALDRAFDGSIRDVRLYNRILSVDEIEKLHSTTR
ncbi:LamG domain-containing protein [bacterium]|nr:LamG domain-containing protein [bacterium]MBT6996022.1 LamG domain-containing protein [bacterium]MBT7772325.1 LamG domain-containing protein [bacterium]